MLNYGKLSAIAPDIRSSRAPENILTTNFIDDFPAVLNYGKLSAKFLVSSVKVIDTVRLLSFFKSFTQTTIKILLNVFVPFQIVIYGDTKMINFEYSLDTLIQYFDVRCCC